MAKRHIVTLPNAALAIIEINADNPDLYQRRLNKTMFELSREMLPPDALGRIKPRYPLEKFAREIHSRDAIAGGITHHIPLACREIDSSELPAEQVNRETGQPAFRAAWTDVGGAIVIDMPKARIIHMDRIKDALKRQIDKESDLLLIAEDENDGPAIAATRTRRKALRTIPQTFDLSSATTPEELNTLWPSEIERPST